MENIPWITVEIAFAGINTALVYLLVQAFLKKQNKAHVAWKIAAIIAVIAAKFFAGYYHIENVFVISSISILSAFLIGIVCFQAKVIWIWISAAFSFLAGGMSELLAVFMIAGYQTAPIGNVMQLGIFRLQTRTLAGLFILLIIAIVSRLRIGDMKAMSAKLMLSLCVPPIVSILIVQQFATHIMIVAYIPTINEVIPMLSIITVNIFIFVLIEGIIRQNEKKRALLLIELQNAAQQKYINQLVDTHEQIRKMSHDFKHRVKVLYTLCKEQQYDKLLTVLSETKNSYAESLIVKTENTILDATLSSMIEEAVKQGIDFKPNLNVHPNLTYMSMDICVLLGNAFDNAIEACIRSSDKRKFIELDLTATESKFMFRMRNTVGELPQHEGSFLKTKKSDALYHGIGLQSMKQTCNELNGDLTYEYDNECFMLWVYINILPNSP